MWIPPTARPCPYWPYCSRETERYFRVPQTRYIYIYTHATPLHQYTTRITTIVQSEEYLRHDAYVRDEKTTSRRTTTREAIHTRNLPAAAAARRRRHTCTRSPPAFHSFYRRVHRGWVPVHVNIYIHMYTSVHHFTPLSLSPSPSLHFFLLHAFVSNTRAPCTIP